MQWFLPWHFICIFWHFERWRFPLFSSCCMVSARPFLIPHGLFQSLRHQILMRFHGIRSLWRVRFHLTWQSILRSVQTEHVFAFHCFAFPAFFWAKLKYLTIRLATFVSHHMFRMLCQDKRCSTFITRLIFVIFNSIALPTRSVYQLQFSKKLTSTLWILEWFSYIVINQMFDS